MQAMGITRIRILAISFVFFFIPIFSHGGAKWDIDDTRWLSLGGGLRTSFRIIEDGAPNGEDASKEFALESARLYLNGQVLPYLKFEMNTEKDGDSIRILDAVAKFEFCHSFNVWAGRFLPPSDRSNLSGPYYLSTFDFPYVQAYPAVFAGRDDGMAVWGEFQEGKFKYQGGLFNGARGTTNPSDSLLFAGRLTYNFLDPESGYYNSSTYYGEKDVLAVGLVGMWQQQDDSILNESTGDFNAWNIDALFEKKISNSGVITIEGARYDYHFNDLVQQDSYFILAGYLFPGHIGKGQFQPHVRFQRLTPEDGEDHSRTEIGVNYILRGHDARISVVYSMDDPAGSNHNTNAFVAGLQLQL